METEAEELQSLTRFPCCIISRQDCIASISSIQQARVRKHLETSFVGILQANAKLQELMSEISALTARFRMLAAMEAHTHCEVY